MNKLVIAGIVGAIAIFTSITIFFNKNEADLALPPVPPVSTTDKSSTTESTNENPTIPSTPKTNSQENTVSDGGIHVTFSDSTKFDTAIANARQAQANKNYSAALAFYIEALGYKKSDVVYADLYTLQLLLNDPTKAKQAVMTAIELKPDYTEYWNWLLILKKEKFNANFAELKAIYDDGYSKANPDTKVNLVTYFARIAGDMAMHKEAIAYWQLAVTLNPDNVNAYEAEIKSLEAKL